MRIVRSAQSMTAWSQALHREGPAIGLVPTMGALHDGHRALIRAARLSCDAVVVSLFVNPLQFGRGEDLSRYPRQFRSEGADVLFAPTRKEMYPPGFQTSVIVQQLSRRWEGEHRPSHFEGVATVVTKLLSLIRPDKAFFGQKDFQQAALVRRLVKDLNLGAEVVILPTVREPDGLAKSSRNVYLTAKQRRAAPVLFAALQAGEAAIKSGMTSAARVQRVMQDRIATEPLARVDYLAVCDSETLAPLPRIAGKTVLLGAIRIGRVRLIDNLLVRAPRS
ncbi:MAG: pantoate--beta-alanine ligase [Nitrospiraceae bacterium]